MTRLSMLQFIFSAARTRGGASSLSPTIAAASIISPSTKPLFWNKITRGAGVNSVGGQRQWISFTSRNFAKQPADDPNFTSVVDNPPRLVRAGGGRKRFGVGFMVLAIIPITAFFLGTWQVKRLGWKTSLLARLEDRIVRPPLPLPPDVDPEAAREFDYRRVYARGRFRHDQEMLVGPRINDGDDGYFVVTPLEREGVEQDAPVFAAVGGAGGNRSRLKKNRKDGAAMGSGEKPQQPPPKGGSTVLVNRGWIAKEFRDQKTRTGIEGALDSGEVVVQGLLREPWKKNRFTPDNRPDIGEFYFPDVEQMARLTGSAPIWIEETTEPDMLEFMDKKATGIPIARAAVVDVRNNHSQYIVTWYGLSLATSIMLYLVAKKPPADASRRVRMNRSW